MSRRHGRRTALLLTGLAVLAVMLAPTPVSAHEVGDLLTNYESRSGPVTPAVEGVEVRVIEAGNRVEVRNRTDRDLVVLGYGDEPYLRVGPHGVFENLQSPATYANRAADGSTEPPPDLDPDGPPEWRRIHDEPVARWHDHRVHWMGVIDPPEVQEAPGREHVVSEWTVAMVLDGARIEATGEIVWVPPPSAAPWLAGAAVLAGALVALGWRWWRHTTAVGLVGLAITSATAAGGLGAFIVGSVGEQAAEALRDAPYLPALVATTLAALVLVARRHRLAPYLVVVAGVTGATFAGLGQLGVLDRSIVPSALAAPVARGLVAAAIGLGTGLAALGIWAIMVEGKTQPTRRDPRWVRRRAPERCAPRSSASS